MAVWSGWNAGLAVAQAGPPQTPAAPPAGALAAQPPPAPLTPPGQTPPSPTSTATGTLPGRLSTDVATITYAEMEMEGSHIRGRLVKVEIGEYTLTGGRVEGDLNREVVFSDGAALTYRGQIVTGDTIRFEPKTKRYRVENVRTALSPEFLRGRVLSPVYLRGVDVYGRQGEAIVGDDIEATTCDKEVPDYFIRAASVTVEPGKDIIFKKAAFVLWGKHLFTLPTLIIPLNRSLHRTSYTPQFGRSVDEGFFVKSALSYLLANRTPGLLRLDLMEKKGIGTGIDQAWNLAKAVGLLTLYAIPTGGTSKNLSGRLNNRFLLGGGEAVTVSGDFQRNSYLAVPDTTNFNTRIDFTRNVTGYNTNFNLSRMISDSGSSFTHSYAATVTQGVQFGQTASANFNADYSSYTSGTTSGTGTSQTTQQLNTRLQADQRASNYTLELRANKSIPVGSSGQSFFGGVERLPELDVNSYRFTHGFLSQLPATFLLSLGQFREPSSAQNGTPVDAQRAVMGFDLQNVHYGLTRRTDLNITGGFQQSFYTDGFAQYVIKNNTTLTQRWGHQSGMNFNYTYQRPEGGTPFRFDQIGQYHSITADAGMLDSRHFQLTARTGYDFAQTAFPGEPARPWQTLSINALIRPASWIRDQSLFAFDPNTGKFIAITNAFRVRGHRDMAMDLVTRFDSQQHRLANINTFFNLPIGRNWRVLGILRYNGYLGQFESRNIQVIRDLHCLEAAVTYIDNPFGFRQDRQIFFQLRIKAIPIFNQFGVGQSGQALDTGVGNVF